MLSATDLDSLLRQACREGERECIAASALAPATLRPVLERAGAILARDLTRGEHEHGRSEETVEETGEDDAERIEGAAAR